MKRQIFSLLFATCCCLFFEHCGQRHRIDVKPGGATFNGTIKILIGNENDDPNLVKKTFDQIKRRIQYADLSSSEPDKNTYNLSIKEAGDTTILKRLISESITLEFSEVFTIKDLEEFLTQVVNGYDNRNKNINKGAGSLPKNNNPRTLMEVIAFKPPYNYNGSVRYPAQIGLVKVKDTAFVNKILAEEKFSVYKPTALKFAYGKYLEDPAKTDILALYALKLNMEGPNPYPTGDQISNVTIINEKDTGTKKPVIGFEFNQEGAQAWAYMTRKNIGYPIAICANDLVLTAPVVDGPIEDGRSRINVDIDDLELWYLVTMMRSGRLVLPVKIISSNFSASK